MGTEQDKWFERLKGIAEKSARQKQIEVGQTVIKDIEKLISDLQTYQIELEIQNEELRRSQTELKNSQDRFAQLFDFAPIGYIVLDQNGFVVDANNTISTMLGRKSDAIRNKPFFQFVYPEDQTIFLARFKSFYKNSINKTLEVRLKSQDNTHFFSRIEGRFVEFNDCSSDTVTERLLLNITDISEGIRQEKLLISTQEKLKYILDSLPDMILEVDSDMKVLWANKSALDLNPDAIGQNCHEAFPGNEDICDGCFCAKAFKTKNLETGIMYQPASKSAGESYWENLGIPLNNKNGKKMTVLEVSRNVTARVKAEKEKETLITQLESALKNVKQLSGLLPICAHCKKIRDDNGYWKQIESYLYEHSEAEFSHSICRDCAKKYYPDMDIYENE